MLKKMKTYLLRLKRNEKGNVLPIMAAALIPILATIGGGVDYARVSLAQAKLQEAVDSAALAGRRGMSRDDIETARPHVEAFMNFNFPEATLGTEPLTLTLTKPDTGVVRVQADTVLKSTILRIIGIEDFNISAVGEATQNLDNVDIVLVLDTTGSMNESLGGQRKIEALKDAVRSLYEELEPAQTQLRSQNLRMRIGVVPYSSTVNVGKILRSMDANYVETQKLTYHHWYRKGNNWHFGEVDYDLTGYANGGALGNRNGHDNHQNARWDGCIEERQTVSTITGNDPRNAPPADALDLDIDLFPGWDEGSKWKPYVYDPLNGEPNRNCPSEVTPLDELDLSDIERIVGELKPEGSTYHDIGMIWGARLISSGGVFGSENPSSYNGRPVNRHIIYMTDGEMSAPIDSCGRTFWGYCYRSTADHSAAYSGYGIEGYDKRVGGTNTNDNNARHTKRFLMACNAAKGKNISVWTIAFGTGKVDSLTRCASNDDQAYTVNDSDDLVDRFAEIGRNIGALRLSE